MFLSLIIFLKNQCFDILIIFYGGDTFLPSLEIMSEKHLGILIGLTADQPLPKSQVARPCHALHEMKWTSRKNVPHSELRGAVQALFSAQSLTGQPITTKIQIYSFFKKKIYLPQRE